MPHAALSVATRTLNLQIYDDHFSQHYGFWRPYIEQVVYRYLDCGNIYNGFCTSNANTGTMKIFWPSVVSVAAFNWQYSILFSYPF